MRVRWLRLRLAAILGFAASFVFSCSSGDGFSVGGGLGGGSSLGNCVDDTVRIGTQVWQKCNSNIVPSSGVSSCYENNPANCAKYGRLYDWEAAKSACPSGFRLPTKADLNALTTFIERDKNCKDCDAKHLKTTSGWYWAGFHNENGLDSYGFSALPGGRGSDGEFFAGDLQGYWWSSTEDEALFYGNKYAYYLSMNSSDFADNEFTSFKSDLYSVRCLQEIGSSSSSVSGGNSSDSGPDLPPCVDSTITIGTQVWQRCNLNVVPTGVNGAATNSVCYDNQTNNCAKYGRLYNWATAMALPDSCNDSSCSGMIDSPHRGICPTNFHIPSNADWDKLIRYVDGSTGTLSPYDSPTAGRYLKSQSGWNRGGNGEDTYGFSAIPGGFGNSGGSFYDVGDDGYWWSASEGNSYEAYYRYMGYYSEHAYWNYNVKSFLFSVRCLQD